MPSHPELLGPIKFDKSFKFMIRDFYCYGFKSAEQMAILETDNSNGSQGKHSGKKTDTVSKFTVRNNWDRLKKILNLHDKGQTYYIKWENKKDGTKVCRMKNSESFPINPFHNVYRFCSCREFEYFAQAVATLSPKIQQVWRSPFAVQQKFLDFDLKSGKYLGIQETDNPLKCLEYDKSIEDVEEKDGLKTSEILMLGSKEFTRAFVKKRRNDIEEDDIMREPGLGDNTDLTEKVKNLRIREITNYKREIRTGLQKLKKNHTEKELECFYKEKLSEDPSYACKLGEKHTQKELEDLYVDKLYSDKINENYTQEELERIYTDAMKITRGNEKETDINIDSERDAENNRLQKLRDLGVLSCIQEPGEEGGAGDKRWILNSPTINELIHAGEIADPDFKNHLISALDFYSRYYFLGEVGTFLLDRIQADDSRQISEEKTFMQKTVSTSDSSVKKYESPFRFKHDYFIQAVNDFDLLDLLCAIEEGKWCLIEYRHAFADQDAENVYYLCFPLEIRISVANGREYLMYYDPNLRSCLSLRLDFICSITLYTDKKVRSVLESEKGMSARDIDAGIEKSREILQHIWGVSTSFNGNVKQNTVKDQKLHNVRMTVEYDPVTEPYIKSRLEREGRNGTVSDFPDIHRLEYVNSVYDSQEMNPWINSFASRIKPPVKGARLNRYGEAVDDPEPKKDGKAQIKNNFKAWNVGSNIIAALGKGHPAEQHTLIFNEIFGIYGQIFATIFTWMLSTAEWESEDAWVKEYNAWLDKIVNDSSAAGEDTKFLFKERFPAKAIERLFLRVNKKNKKLTCIYAWNKKRLEKNGEQVSFYGDILPLSGIEIRWLKTILNDDSKKDGKIRYFLSEKEIKAVREFFDQSNRLENELPADKVVYFDRYKFYGDRKQREQANIKELLDLFGRQEKAKVSFMAIPDDTITSDVYQPLKKDDAITEYLNMESFPEQIVIPLRIIFSKRNNFFICCFQSCNDHKIYFINASRITDISGTNDKIALEERKAAEGNLRKYYLLDKHSAYVYFNEENNIPDRVLMQFSPWEKTCTYFSSLKRYQIELFYSREDIPTLSVQLLAYTINCDERNELEIQSSDTEIENEIENELLREVKIRKKKQQELLERQLEISENDRRGAADNLQTPR